MKKRIVFITDCIDVAYNEMRATIISIVGDCDIEIEPVVQVRNFSIINGAFLLRLMAEVYPPETIFVIVLNPMKERPARLIGTTEKKNFTFLSANTGVIGWLLKDFGLRELYEINDSGFIPFGGKYIYAPTAAQFINEKLLSDIGKPFDKNNLKKLEITDGVVVHIDNFGLIKFMGQLPEVNDEDEFEISVNGKNFKAVYFRRMMSRSDGEWVIYPGSSLSILELGKVRQNGAMELGINIGDIIKFKKI
ncbi:SAM-dependent chlorinase/fluorinase [Candidatus Wolfebacteria bacterium]|nr:SAM-dependent chlorinase/fluorinase [Candidatus Wolfebacteria bacterium]